MAKNITDEIPDQYKQSGPVRSEGSYTVQNIDSILNIIILSRTDCHFSENWPYRIAISNHEHQLNLSKFALRELICGLVELL